MRLLSISVSGLRCLLSTDRIPIDGLAILTGANDSGKSTLLLALGLLLGDQKLDLSDVTLARDGEDLADLGGVRDRHAAEVRVCGEFLASPEEQQRLGVGAEVLVRWRYSDGRGQHEVFQSVPEDPALRGLDNMNAHELRSLVAAHSIAVANRRENQAMLGPLKDYASSLPSVEEWADAPPEVVQSLPDLVVFEADSPEAAIRSALRSAYTAILEDEEVGAQLDDLERRIRERLKVAAGELETHIVEACSDLKHVTIEPQVKFKDQFPAVQVKAGRLQEEQVALGGSGSGRTQRISLAAWEFTEGLLKQSSRDTVICYDEPDTHLDYRHQRELVDVMLRQAQMSHVSVVAASHSLNLIDKVPIDSVVCLVQDNGRTTVARLLTDDHQATDAFLVRVAASLGLRTSVLMHERCFVAVEGPSESQSLPILFLKVKRQPMQSAGLALIAANSNAGAVRLAGHLAGRGRPVQVVVDRDTFENKGARKLFKETALIENGIDPKSVYYLGDREYEDMFDDHLWAGLANDTWPRSDGRPWEEADFSALRGSGKFSADLCGLIGKESCLAPGDKPAYVTAMAEWISVSDVPEGIHELFKHLVELAE